MLRTTAGLFHGVQPPSLSPGGMTPPGVFFFSVQIELIERLKLPRDPLVWSLQVLLPECLAPQETSLKAPCRRSSRSFGRAKKLKSEWKTRLEASHTPGWGGGGLDTLEEIILGWSLHEGNLLRVVRQPCHCPFCVGDIRPPF